MTRQRLLVVGGVLLVALLAAGLRAATDPVADLRASTGPVAEMRASADAFAAAWNHDDTKAMAAEWAPDGDVINPFGHAAKGRAEIEAFFQKEHGTMTKGTTFKVSGFTARLLRPDLALEDFDVSISGGTMAPDPAHPVEHHVFAVAKRQGAHWYWLALRAYRTAEPPAPAAAAAKS